jgi:hypothetical protein
MAPAAGRSPSGRRTSWVLPTRTSSIPAWPAIRTDVPSPEPEPTEVTFPRAPKLAVGANPSLPEF